VQHADKRAIMTMRQDVEDCDPCLDDINDHDDGDMSATPFKPPPNLRRPSRTQLRSSFIMVTRRLPMSLSGASCSSSGRQGAGVSW
jgi:hypothetical protein